MAKTRLSHNTPAAKIFSGSIRLFLAAIILTGGIASLPAFHAKAATLLSANFNSTTDGFTYGDDPFGTSQPSYASGVRSTTGGYGATGGLQVTLGGVDANAITGMSGGWSYTLSLAGAETGVVLSFRYRLSQTATYEYDEYSRVLVKVDGVQLRTRAEDLYRSHKWRRFELGGQLQHLPADH